MTPFIVINVAEGAIQVNQNTETLLDMQAKLANISQRLDDLVVNVPAQIAELTAEAQAEVNRLKTVVTDHPPPA